MSCKCDPVGAIAVRVEEGLGIRGHDLADDHGSGELRAGRVVTRESVGRRIDAAGRVRRGGRGSGLVEERELVDRIADVDRAAVVDVGRSLAGNLEIGLEEMEQDRDDVGDV